MINKIVRRISLLSLILLVSCGGGKDEEEFKFYALKEGSSRQKVQAFHSTYLLMGTYMD
mgnify:CR=1 FL=1